MSYVFDFAMYAIAIASVLALYGSSLKSSKAPSSVPTPASVPVEEVTIADFAEEVSELEIPEEAIALMLAEVGFEQPTVTKKAIVAPAVEDAIVPFTRKRKPAPADSLESLGIRALREIASKLKISKYSRKSKAQLVAEIRSLREAQAA